MPVVDSIAELNELLNAADAKDDHRRIANRVDTVGADFAFERDLLRPLPTEPFPTALTLTPRVDRYARITVRQRQYSVPARFIGHRVRVHLGASTLIVFDGRVEIARHERSTAKGGQVLVLDHYLEVLARKRWALAGATALVASIVAVNSSRHDPSQAGSFTTRTHVPGGIASSGHCRPSNDRPVTASTARRSRSTCSSSWLATQAVSRLPSAPSDSF